MKRNFAGIASLKPSKLIVLGISSLFLTSCSSQLLRRGQTVDSIQHDGNTQVMATVPKEQYDELARKYQELINQSKQLAKSELAVPPTDSTSLKKIEGQAKPEIGEVTAIDPSDLVNHIDKAIPDTVSLESSEASKPEVSLEKKAGPAVPSSMGVEHINNTDDIDEQILKLREVQDLVKVNKFENALTILKELENSKERQIVVRAKLMLGDLLFNQGEFDLASQVYEEIIKKYAFSGYVLKALGKLVSCSEKLKQPEKQAKYYSLLHDFFEAT